jgi:hypothetical protein
MTTYAKQSCERESLLTHDTTHEHARTRARAFRTEAERLAGWKHRRNFSLESSTLNSHDQEPLGPYDMNSQSDFPAAPSLITFNISSPLTAGVRFS